MLNGKSMTFVQQHKYMGIILTEDMFDVPDMMQQVKATYAKGNVLISVFIKCNETVKDKPFKNTLQQFLWLSPMG